MAKVPALWIGCQIAPLPVSVAWGPTCTRLLVSCPWTARLPASTRVSPR